MIDIRNLDKAEVLKVLYDASHHLCEGCRKFYE